MPNTESFVLRMNQLEADSTAYVLMTALHHVTMLPRERVHIHAVANELFKQLGYGHGTGEHGERIEWNTTPAK